MRPRPALLLTVLSLCALVVGAPGGAAPTAATDTTPEWGPVDESPIRPGASLGGYCTYNWVFHDEPDPLTEPDRTQAVYIGTAGHCTDEVGERVTLPGVGQIGSVVYDSDLVDSDVDFSLVRIDDELIGRTNPTMIEWGGPTGSVTTAELSVGDRVDIHGYGIVLGQNDVTRSRFGVLMSWNDDEYIANMPAVFGDSGSPLLHHDTGKALGIISRFAFTETPPSTDVGPLMSWIFDELADAGFGDVVLATATDG
jgi:hypothetical protein